MRPSAQLASRRGTAGVRGLLDYYTCGNGEWGYPDQAGVGYAFLLSYRGMGPDELLAAAILGADFGDEEPSAADRHILRFGLRDGRRQVIEDTVDNGGIHGPRDEKSLTPERVRELWQAIGRYGKPPAPAVPPTPHPVPRDVSASMDIADSEPGPCGWSP